MAENSGGKFELRIEDIDTARSRPEFETAILDDLAWLGLRWPKPVWRQSDRLAAYATALDRLRVTGLIYPCTCTAATSRPPSPPPRKVPQTSTARVYPGTCRGRTDDPPNAAWRLDLATAIARLGGPHALAQLLTREIGPIAPGVHALDAEALLAEVGDVVLARKDIGTSYHMAAVVDDAAQGITHVVRGADLLPATPLHRLLQALMGYPVPLWHHHRLIRDETGRRLAKRDRARSLAALREDGATASDIRAMLGLARGVARV